MKKLFVLMVLLGVLFIVFISPGNTVEAQADDSMRMNERKYFTSYVVENGRYIMGYCGAVHDSGI